LSFGPIFFTGVFLLVARRNSPHYSVASLPSWCAQADLRSSFSFVIHWLAQFFYSSVIFSCFPFWKASSSPFQCASLPLTCTVFYPDFCGYLPLVVVFHVFSFSLTEIFPLGSACSPPFSSCIPSVCFFFFLFRFSAHGPTSVSWRAAIFFPALPS